MTAYEMRISDWSSDVCSSDLFGLPPESIKSRLVEVSGGKAWFPSGREAPRTIIAAFAGHVEIVAVEHAMNKARRHIGCREVRRIFPSLPQQGDGWWGVRVRTTDPLDQPIPNPLRHPVLLSFDLLRSDEGRVGKGCVSKFRSGW